MSLERSAVSFFNASGASPIKLRAWAQYQKLGLPDRKNELWKYSSLQGVTQREWRMSESSTFVPLSAQLLMQAWSNDFDVLLLVNGELRSQSAFAASEESDIEISDGFTGLAVAVARPGLRIRISTQQKRPVLIIHAHDEKPGWTPVAHSVQIDAHAHVYVTEVFLGAMADTLRTDVMHVHLGEQAHVQWVRIQSEGMEARHFDKLQAELARGANLNLTVVHAGSAWCRSDILVQVRGEGAEAHVQGLLFGRQSQHVDQRVEVRHSVGHTASSQLFKAVLTDRARGVVNGKIFIAQNAQKVASSQINHNLLLSSLAEADTKPELEIYADDVKANHGASVGRLDQDKLFYLLSRGIPKAEAQTMLAQGFINDVLMKITHPGLRLFVRAQMDHILPDYSTQMEHQE